MAGMSQAEITFLIYINGAAAPIELIGAARAVVAPPRSAMACLVIAMLAFIRSGQRAEGPPRFRSPRFDIPLPPRLAGAAAAGRATLGIRPEHVGVRIGTDGAAALPVRLVEPLGKDTLLYFDDGTPRAFIAVSEGLRMAAVTPGETVALSFDPERLYLFAEDGRRLR
jgi:ABC-type sugar transport system ATPase subunit